MCCHRTGPRASYLDLALNFATVRWDGAQLHLKSFQAAAKSLIPTGGVLLRSNDRSAASHVLLTSSDDRHVISDGFRTFEQVSQWRMVPLWASLAAGVSGLVCLVLAGVFREVRRQLRPADPLFASFLAAVALVLPGPFFFFTQSFPQLGDLTLASALLALVTGALPLAMAFGLWRRVKRVWRGQATSWRRQVKSPCFSGPSCLPPGDF